MAADDTTNIEVQEAINKAIAARSALLTKQTEIMKGQIQLALELAAALKGEKLEGMRERIDQITAGISAAKTASDDASSSIAGMSGAITDAGEKANKAGGAFERMTKKGKDIGEIMGDAFAKTGAQLDGIVGLIGSAARGITSMGMAILSVPFKMFDYLVDGASELMNGSNELREAFENVRDTFGDLNKAEAKGVIDSFGTLRASSASLGGSGLSLAKVFGVGQGGLAQALNALNETAAAMGPLFGVLQGQFVANADKLLVLQKGLGMSNEEMAALGSVAVATGGDMTQMMQEMGNLALQMGDRFGISSKLIGKDLAYMTANMGKFGSMTKTQMVTSSVYLRKLGMELKNIEGLMGAFDDFETAAQNAAKLAQGFGMTVDAFKMMKEQDPAKRLDMLRQAFSATGKSIESMSRQERAMLASSAGLDENMVSLALSSKNMGKSYDQVQKEAEKSNKKQLSQAEVMDKLADNIKKLTESMSNSGGFMERFFKGFEHGLKHSGPMMRLFRNLGQSLWGVEGLGRKVGKMFADLFPGISDMANALADFFDPKKFSALTDGLLADFKKFFEDLGKDPVKAAEDFMKKMKEKFFNFFNKDSDIGKRFLDGANKFGKAIAGILGAMGKWLIEGATKAVKGLIEYIKNPVGLSEGAQSGIMSMVAPMIDAIGGALPALGEALLDLLITVAKKYGPMAGAAVGGLLALNFAAGVAKGAIEGTKEGLMEAAKAKIKDAVSKLFTPKVVAPPDDAAAPIDATGQTVGALNKITLADIGKALVIALALVTLISVGIVAFAKATQVAAGILMGVNFEDVVKVFASTTMGVLATIGLASVAKLIKPQDLGKAVLGMLAAAAFATVGIVAFAKSVAIAAETLKDTNMSDIEKVFASTAVGVMATLGLAVAGALLVADGGATLAIATLGMLAAAGFATIGIVAFAGAVWIAAQILKNTPGDQIAKVFITTAIGVAATLALALAGAALGTPVGLAALGLAALGMGAAALFMVGAFATYLTAIKEIVDNAPSIDFDKAIKLFGLVGLAVIATAGMLAVAVGMKIATMFSSMDKMTAFMNGIIDFFDAGMSGFIGVIDKVASMPMADPDAVQSKINVIKSVIEALASFVGIAVDATQLGAVSELLGGPSLADTMTAMSGFMKSSADNMVDIVKKLSETAMSWSPDDLKKIESMANIVGAVAGLAGSLSEPIKSLSGINGEWFGDSATEKMDKVVQGIQHIMNKMANAIPGIVTSMQGIQLGDLTKEKIDIIRSALAGFSDVTKVTSELVKTSLSRDMKDVDITAVMSKALDNSVLSLEKLNGTMPQLKKSADALVQYKEIQLGGTVKAIVDDIKAVNDALADLGAINVNSSIDKLGEALQLKTEVLNIERKPIQLSVNLNLTMKAEDITKEIFDVAAKLAKKEGVPGTEPIKQAFGVS